MLSSCCLAVILASPPATPPPEDDFEPGWLPTVLAAGPGFIVHGLGHMVAGDTDTGLDLLLAEGVGLGMVVGGTAVLALTGASRRTAGPNVVVIGGGMGLFVTSWLADIAGSNGSFVGNRQRARLPLEAHLGYRYIHDPQFDYQSFTVIGVDGQLGRWGLEADAWLALDDENWRVRQRTRRRLLGAMDRGSRLDAVAGLGWHAHGTEGFAFMTVEGQLAGRLDLGDVLAPLDGTFAEGSFGWSIEMYDYDIPGLGFAEDVFDQLLFRFSYGVYFGGGELAFEYDHRRDSFAQGMGMDGIGAGGVGSIGLRGGWPITDDWSVDAEYLLGSAHVLGLSARWRGL